jgi:hypothetical protein
VTLPPGQRLIEGSRALVSTSPDPLRRSRPIPSSKSAGRSPTPSTCPSPPWPPFPRRELSADLHCVAGWSATNLCWEGVSFETFYRSIIAPALPPDTVVTHVVFGGLDGYRSVVTIEDALADGVLIAERLHGRPLDGDHGAPARLVSPAQYGYVSTKHLCRVEVHTTEPKDPHASPISLLFRRHPRARVWEEERHGYFPRLVGAARLPSPQSPLALSLRPRQRPESHPATTSYGSRFRMRLPNAAHDSRPARPGWAGWPAR